MTTPLTSLIVAVLAAAARPAYAAKYQRVVPIDIKRTTKPGLDRSATTSLPCTSNSPWAPDVVYETSVQIGTPQRRPSGWVRIGHWDSDLWVKSPDAASSNAFDRSNSSTDYSTFSSAGSHSPNIFAHFSTSAATSTNTVTIGGTVLQDQSFILLETVSTSPAASNDDLGYLSLGGNRLPYVPYQGVPWQLRNQSYTAIKAHGIYMDTPTSDTGTLILGGVDTDKYIDDPNIQKTPILSELGVTVENVRPSTSSTTTAATPPRSSPTASPKRPTSTWHTDIQFLITR
ncbi:aspartic peptidase domain-containing protein [Bombardia bombarda]|uniref:Aspartic peptidase domain-containing protein n=1 Tax=Bombardia bombarda TaxID=252184 RepID=A0AA39X0M3_9PEZI|nr:aspartic peptidase domain-containing protein [Bombardia bombarda]